MPVRRGLWEHIRDGRMSHMEALAFIYICSQADTRTGIWKGSAKSLTGELGLPERTARDVLEKMEHGDYIRRFAVPGRHNCYPILIHKFPLTQGEHNGEQLNALDSKSPIELSYVRREYGVGQDGEHSVEHGAAQRRIENREKGEKKKQQKKAASAPATTEISNTTLQAFRALGYEQPFGPPEFQSIWTHEYSQVQTENPCWTDIMERAILRCQEADVRVPSLFFAHKREIEKSEVRYRYHRTPL